MVLTGPSTGKPWCASAITHLVQAGVDLPTVKRISGHKTLAMVERHSHQSGTHIQAAMDKLQARFKLASQSTMAVRHLPRHTCFRASGVCSAADSSGQ
jgi:hypothetical protein